MGDELSILRNLNHPHVLRYRHSVEHGGPWPPRLPPQSSIDSKWTWFSAILTGMIAESTYGSVESRARIVV